MRALFFSVLFVILVVPSISLGEGWRPNSIFECGMYDAVGRWKMVDGGKFILSVNDGSSNQTELLVVGGNFKEKLTHIGRAAKIRFYVPRKIDGETEPIVFLKEFVNLPQKALLNQYFLVKREKCGLAERFTQRD